MWVWEALVEWVNICISRWGNQGLGGEHVLPDPHASALPTPLLMKSLHTWLPLSQRPDSWHPATSLAICPPWLSGPRFTDSCTHGQVGRWGRATQHTSFGGKSGFRCWLPSNQAQDD